MIAFADNFPHGPARQQRRVPNLARHPDAGQALAVLGAGLLAVGVFLPFLHHWRLDAAPSLWQQETALGMPWASLAILSVAALGGWLGGRRSYVFLWPVGFVAYVGLALAMLYSAQLAHRAAPAVARPTGFFIDPTELFALAAGWYVSAAGALLLFGGALVDGLIDHQRSSLPRAHIQFAWRERESMHIPKALRGSRPSES